MTYGSLDSLFRPSSIAVIGVSRDDRAVGSTIFSNLAAGSFRGRLYPVNPFVTEYRNRTCFPSVVNIPDSVDLAIISVPSDIVCSVLLEIGQKHIPAAVIVSSGFSESGQDGIRKEEDVKEIARKLQINIVGPNCLGVIHPKDGINASFARTKPLSGNIAFLSQSGALGTAILDIVTPKGIGFSHFISFGNKAGVNEFDCLEYLSRDQQTSVIGLYVEQMSSASACIRLGRLFATLSPPKPVVILKGGKTSEGAKAVRSHTGSLAGLPEVYSALIRQSTAIEAHSVQEFVNALVCFSENPLPSARSCVTVTNAGGPGILATDILVNEGVEIQESSLVRHNPLDLLGDANADQFSKALSDLEHDPGVGSILGIVTPQAMTDVPGIANAFCIHKKRSTKPFAACFMGDLVMSEGKQILDMGHVPVSKYPEQSALMLSHLIAYAERRRMLPREPVPVLPHDMELSFDNPFLFLKPLGIDTPTHALFPYPLTAPLPLEAFSDSLAVKLISDQIIHKTDVGAVSLSVPKGSAVDVINDMAARVHKEHPDATIRQILVMDMVDTKKGIETIIGIKKEPNLGMAVMLGLGGIFVDMLRDVTFRFAPFGPDEAMQMIRELKGAAIFTGYRGRNPANCESLAASLSMISVFASQHPEIQELDINPYIVMPVGSSNIALDVRVTIDRKP